MFDHPPLAPHDPFGVESNLNEDDPRTSERRSRAVSSFSPVPLFSPPLRNCAFGPILIDYIVV